jgi:hypothetical protein
MFERLLEDLRFQRLLAEQRSTRSAGLLIDTVVCLTLAKWETVSGRFGGYLTLSPLHDCGRVEIS